MRNVAVIGGGPAGMMAAIAAAKEGAQVTLYEKNEKLGKKLYITGKGRCNLTNTCPMDTFADHIVRGKKFLFSALSSFDNRDVCDFFEQNGLALKEERGGRVFPVSDHSSDVIKALEQALRNAGVKVRLRTEVQDISRLEADAVVIATGGLSYPTTGSTGDGYRFAETIGHSITEPVPSLVPLLSPEDFIRELEGLSLRNIRAQVKADGKVCFDEFGEMLFTAHGVSGPLILSASGLLCREMQKQDKTYVLHIDLKPALELEQLDKRILRDFESEKNKQFKNALGKLLPSKMIPVMIRRSGIDPQKKVNEITKAERTALVSLFKDFCITIDGTADFSQAVITSGGVDVKKINPKTMQSKIRPDIFFAGEVMDVDAFTGGYNLQIAFSTGRAAGIAAAKEENV